MATPPIVIAGAGSIGCFVGAWLLAAGVPVRLLARQRVVDELVRYGLTASDCDGSKRLVAPESIKASAAPDTLAGAQLVLVTVKSGATAEIASLIARHVAPGATIVSLQNGVGNVALLRERLAGYRVLAGMVPYNVVALGEGRFHRATGGELVIEAAEPWPGEWFASSGLATRASANMEGVAWGKLVINLNNALNALSGLPLAAELADAGWRRLLADSMTEALAALDAAGIVPVRSTPLHPRVVPWVMRAPNWLYRRLTHRQIRIDPKARSSMWDDLEQRRKTEVDFLQGAVVELAARAGLKAPLNERVRALIHEAEARAAGSPHLTPAAVRRSESRAT